MTTTATHRNHTDIRPLHHCMDACILDGLTHDPDFLPGYGVTLHLVWNDEALPRAHGLGDHALALLELLTMQAARYRADGLEISAGDCHWIAAKVRAGALRLITNDTWAAVPIA
jgi:hypothetical protein